MIQSFTAGYSSIKAFGLQPSGVLMFIIVRVALLRGVREERGPMNVAFCPPSANECRAKLCMTRTGPTIQQEEPGAGLPHTNQHRSGIITGEHPRSSLHTTSEGTPLSSCLLCLVLPSLGAGLNVTSGTVEMRSKPGSHSSPQTAPGWLWLDKQLSRRPQIPPECGNFCVKIFGLEEPWSCYWREGETNIYRAFP